MKVLLIVYDNGSYIHSFPLGTAYIAAYLQRDGHEVEIYNQDIYHYREDHLTQYLNENDFDVVGLGFIAGYSQYKKILSISKAINNADRHHMFIIGGHGPSPEPEYFLRKTGADFVVIGEGEKTISELLQIPYRRNSYHDIHGIAYIDSKGNYIQTEKQNLIKNVDEIMHPAWNLFNMDYYALFRSPGFDKTDRTMFVITGRGCPYKCTFCYRMDEGFRPRSNHSIIQEIFCLKDSYGITAIMFADELLMSSKKRVMSFCEDLIEQEVNIKWYCNGRLNIVDRELLKIMKKAGCVFINYGVECLDDNVLRNMNKKLTVKQITEGVQATKEECINQGLNVMFGNIGDNEDTLNATVEFIIKYDNSKTMRTIRPVTPYPGSPLYYDAIEKGLLSGPEDFYENKHVNADLLTVNFTELSNETFYLLLKDANERLVNSYYEKNKKNSLEMIENLYDKKDVDFRGFRQQ